jgi:hypothetical protein
MLLAQNARRAESGWQLSESSYQSVAGTVDAAVVSHRFDRFDHFFCPILPTALLLLCALWGEACYNRERERERERERCSLQRDKSSRRAEGVPPGAPSKKRVTERERGRKFFFLSHILACCFFLLNRCPISFVVRLRASLFARTSSLSEREELPRARHHCLSLTL